MIGEMLEPLHAGGMTFKISTVKPGLASQVTDGVMWLINWLHRAEIEADLHQTQWVFSCGRRNGVIAESPRSPLQQCSCGRRS